MLDGRPSLLAGPILRRCDQHVIYVWLATAEPLEFRGKVIATTTRGEITGTESYFSVSERWKLGEHLYVHLVGIASGTEESKNRLVEPLAMLSDDEASATLGNKNVHLYDHGRQRLPTAARRPLPTEELLGYQLEAQTETAEGIDTLGLSELVPSASICYPDFTFPTFILQERERGALRVLYGSCRKLNGVGADAMKLADRALEESAAVLRQRPSVLFLGGDQIYADDVASLLMPHIVETARWVAGQSEYLPTVTAAELNQMDNRLNGRADVVTTKAKFTSGEAGNHLIRFGEYVAMYLLAWNPSMWPTQYPNVGEAIRLGFPIGHYRHDRAYELMASRLDEAKEGSGAARRVMANIATYMIFDDHDVTDDWYLDEVWKQEVLGTRLGATIVANALAAYWAFQGWGNQPESSPTQDFKLPVSTYLNTQHQRDFPGYLLALIEFDNWAFVTPTSPPAVVLDTRTKRSSDAPAQLMNNAELTRLLRVFRQSQGAGLIVVAATPVLGIPGVESAIESAWFPGLSAQLDFESFSYKRSGFSKMMNLFADSGADPIIIISGDVHYGFAVNGQIRVAGRRVARVAQFTSSALKNQPDGAALALLIRTGQLVDSLPLRSTHPNRHDETARRSGGRGRGRDIELVRQMAVFARSPSQSIFTHGNNVGSITIRGQSRSRQQIVNSLQTARGQELVTAWGGRYNWPTIEVGPFDTYR